MAVVTKQRIVSVTDSNIGTVTPDPKGSAFIKPKQPIWASQSKTSWLEKTVLACGAACEDGTKVEGYQVGLAMSSAFEKVLN